MSFWKYIPTFAKWFGKTIDVTDSDEDLMVRSAGVGGSVASSEIKDSSCGRCCTDCLDSCWVSFLSYFCCGEGLTRMNSF